MFFFFFFITGCQNVDVICMNVTEVRMSAFFFFWFCFDWFCIFSMSSLAGLGLGLALVAMYINCVLGMCMHVCVTCQGTLLRAVF